METYRYLVNRQKQNFNRFETRKENFRIDALKKLRKAVKKYEQELTVALKKDLNKSEFDAYASEIGVVLEEIRFAIKHLPKWMKPDKVKTPLTHAGSESAIYSSPYGTALIIAPWNFPFQLAIAPLIGAIAAGNCAIVKPSELTPATASVISKMLTETFSEEYIAVVNGGVETSQALLNEEVDYIFFTGSVPVGKVVMEAASKQLIPVTLELGGKSPCIIHEDADLELAAKRVAWGKYMNAGQTCIAPDYLYVHEKAKTNFLQHLKESIKDLYGERPLENEDYTHIVNDKHFDRISGLLDNGNTLIGGTTDKEKLVIEPTVLKDVSWEDPVMKDEIFGPVLPVLEYKNLNDVVEGVQHYPNPLALYLFSENEAIQETILNTISFGGGCINDTVYHFTSPHLPFGGVGSSGTGAYHGKGSFDTFSHKKSVLKQTTKFDIPFRYPNVKNNLKKIKLFYK